MAVRVDGDRLDCAQPAKRKTNEKKKSSSSSSRSRTGTRRRKFLLLDLRVCTVHALQSYPVMEEEIVKKKRETFFFLLNFFLLFSRKGLGQRRRTAAMPCSHAMYERPKQVRLLVRLYLCTILV